MNQRQHHTPPQKSPWVNAKTFSKDGITVRIEKAEGWRPRYRMRVGALNKDGEFMPTVLMHLEGQGKVHITRVHETLAALTREAQDWVHNEAQYREDQIMEQNIGREMKQANFGKANVRVTGKTARNRDKRKSAA